MVEDARELDDIHEFLQLVDLDDIVVYEERARRVAWTEAQLEAGLPEPSMSLGVNQSDEGVRFRFRMVLVNDVAEYVADFESVYKAVGEETVTASKRLQQEFAQRVAFMAVYPFLRASIFGSASRLGAPRPVLGLVRQDQFEAGNELQDDEVQELFFDNKSELDDA